MKFSSLKDIDKKAIRPGSFKHHLKHLEENGGRIVKGVNTTVDVGTDEIKKQAAKFGFKVDKDGRPANHPKNIRGPKTNVAFNLGLTESKENSCPRTKASVCQCESLSKVTEAKETITAVCMLEHGNGVEGTILLKQQANGPTMIVGKVTGLKPGVHGFHIHEFGDLSKGCESAGAHYNPDGDDHGDLEQGHVGDLGNITADDSGTADIKIVAERVDLTGERSVVGRAIVVHSDEDDLGKGGDEESLKTGNAGDRLACGVITLKETVNEKWSAKYKKSINCSNPKGFSQKAHCAGKTKKESLEEALGELAQTSEIYVDMDGVLADFFTEWQKLTGKNWREITGASLEPALQKIRDTKDFWTNLPMTKNAKSLLSLIKDVKGEYNILSAPLAGDPKAEPGKRKWIEKNLSFFPPKNIVITADKQKFAKQSDGTPNILIDDFGSNIAKWESAGGVGFKHKDHKFERTAKAIKQHMQEPVEEGNLIPNPQRSTLVKADDVYQWYKLGTNMANIKSMAPNVAKRDKPDIFLQFYGGEKEKKYMMKQLKRLGYDVQDAEGNVDPHYDEDVNETYTLYVSNFFENFADGKKKGKSRPGRVKKAGASCNGSVTSLRKRAKASSGEKAKMYHWCANMKSGRKKK